MAKQKKKNKRKKKNVCHKRDIKRINQALGYPLINENTVCVGFGFEDGTEEQIVLRPDLIAGEVSQ